MEKRKKKPCRYPRIIIAILFSLGVVLVRPSSVYAVNALIKARTIGELIVTILAGSGTAVTNQAVITQIYSNYDTTDFEYESMIENGILTIEGKTTQEAIDALGTGQPYNLDVQEFRDLVYGNWDVMIENGMDNVFRIGDIANTDTVYGAIDNIGQIVRNVAQNGYLGLENTVAIVTNPGTTVQVALENIANAILGTYGSNVRTGIPMDEWIAINDIGAGVRFTDIRNNKSITKYASKLQGIYYATNGKYNESVIGSNSVGIWGVNLNDTKKTIKLYTIEKYGDGTEETREVNMDMEPNTPRVFTNSVTTGGGEIEYLSIPNFQTSQQVQNYLNGLVLGENPIVPYSPDIINQNDGNITENDTIAPAIGQNEGITIIPSDAYETFTDNANENTENDDPQQNAEDMALFIEPYIRQNINPTPIPTVIPQQPTSIPKPTTIPQEVEQVMGATTSGLENIFPFCIPWDIAKMVKKLEAERKAPHITWTLIYQENELGTIDIDMSDFDAVATLCRTLILLLFIIGLAVATRNLIGA